MTDKATLEEIEARLAECDEAHRGVLTGGYGVRLLEICREQAARIKALEDPWRRVKDELPDDGQNVGFVMLWPGNWNHERVLGGRFRKGEDYPEFSVPGLSTEASHWFPMPESPIGTKK